MLEQTQNASADSVSILFADVFGYSVLMEQAEQEVCTITNHCISLFVETSRRYRGQVREIAGDGLMVQFNTADDAVMYAVAMRRTLDRENTELSIGESILFRIGIHTGPVIKVPGGVRGHTINVAARIESEVSPNHIGISQSTFDALSVKERYRFHDEGYRSLKNIQTPVRMYLVEYSARGDSDENAVPGPEATPEDQAPALVIGSFRCIGEESKLDVMSLALAEEIFYHFSKIRDFRLHASDFLGMGEGQLSLATRLCRLASIDYLLDGSIADTVDGFRITTRLVYTRSGEIIDTCRMNINMDSLSSDMLTTAVMLSLRVSSQVENNGLKRAATNLNSGRFGQYLRARKLNRELTEEANERAQQLLNDLIATGEQNGDALVELSHAQHMAWRYGWGEGSDAMLEVAIENSRLALKEDPENAHAFNELAYALMFCSDYDSSREYFSKAEQLNPNDPWIAGNVASAKVYNGNSQEAVVALERSLSLNSTVDADWRLWSLADAYFALQDYPAVIRTISNMQDPSQGHRLAAASHALQGNHKNAKRFAGLILRDQPDFTVSRWSAMLPDADEEVTGVLGQGLVLAGLPN